MSRVDPLAAGGSPISWLNRAASDRLARVALMRREVLRGPLSGAPSPYADPAAQEGIARAFGVTALFLVIIVILLTGATAYYATYSGALRWILYALVLCIVGYVAVRLVGVAARDPEPLHARARAAVGVGGSLTNLRVTLHRAQSGLAYSQVVFEDRLREAFLEKVRAARDLSEEALQAAMRDPVRLQTILGERDLTLFVLESARNSRTYPARMPEFQKRPDFAAHVASLLARMEAWR